ncbi:hypothetical protein DFH06DRAFT_1245811 [Mycena polygramma]|nr:hypothetical protein DFH06DRAFT_1245811 [Mycena polygramma]
MRSLDMSCKFPDNLPSIPQLTELRLNGEFGTYAGYVRFLSDLPALQSLRLDGFFWKDCPRSPPLVVPFPSLDLKAASLHWGLRLPIEPIMFSLRTRKLVLSFWAESLLPLKYLQSISKYLHHLGVHLQYLHLNCLDVQPASTSLRARACGTLESGPQSTSTTRLYSFHRSSRACWRLLLPIVG